MSTKQKAPAENLIEEEKKMDGEVARLEAEQAGLDGPASALTWEEVQSGAAGELEARERRRGILPRLIVAAKVRRLEVRREGYEAELGPLRERREKAHERLEAARAKRLEAAEEENAGRAEYSDAHLRVEGREARIKETDREIRRLRGEA